MAIGQLGERRRMRLKMRENRNNQTRALLNATEEFHKNTTMSYFTKIKYD